MNFDHLDEFIQHQKEIRNREGYGLFCKLHHFSGTCISKFYCADKDSKGMCNYDRAADLSKRKDRLMKTIIYYRSREYDVSL